VYAVARGNAGASCQIKSTNTTVNETLRNKHDSTGAIPAGGLYPIVTGANDTTLLVLPGATLLTNLQLDASNYSSQYNKLIAGASTAKVVMPSGNDILCNNVGVLGTPQLKYKSWWSAEQNV
jgi:hypothetical protein